MSSQDLTTLAAVKAWLGLPAAASPNDPTTSALVTAASRAIYAQLSRPALLPASCYETLDFESERVFLRHWPVLAVSSVSLGGLAVPAVSLSGPPPAFGYRLRLGDVAPPGAPQAIDLFGLDRRRRRDALTIAYTAGYAVQGEAQSVPAASPYALTALAPYGPWARDLGVAYAATGLPLTPVTTPTTAGAYSVAGGVYAFSAADAGAALILSYGYIPQDIAQAATELAAERFRAADRIGLRSKSLGGQETIGYDTSAISAPVLAMLQPYRRAAF